MEKIKLSGPECRNPEKGDTDTPVRTNLEHKICFLVFFTSIAAGLCSLTVEAWSAVFSLWKKNRRLNRKRRILAEMKCCTCVHSCGTDCWNAECWQLMSKWGREQKTGDGWRCAYRKCMCVGCSLAVIHCVWANLCKVKRSWFGGVPPLMRL